ncbi:MAG: heme-copper oxidase subunit III [Actinomycetia bacterium]|nr:heme-copper oxidase subunit III [Actinomycetes bacterium]
MTTANPEVHSEHASPKQRLAINRLGLWLFILSESMLFAGLLMVRFSLLGTYTAEELSQITGLIITVILLLSSFTAYQAERSMRSGDVSRTKQYLLLTLGLGAIFTAGVAFEWYEALEAFPPSTPFGSVFFTMTGLHAFHVITGLVIIAIVYSRVRRATYASSDSWPVEASVKYWHFVDVVWVFFYPALYLLN